jgi:hypothetical protein
MVGHVNHPAAEECLLAPRRGEVHQQQAVLTCRSAFVVSEIDVTGHIDLSFPLG